MLQQSVALIAFSLHSGHISQRLYLQMNNRWIDISLLNLANHFWWHFPHLFRMCRSFLFSDHGGRCEGRSHPSGRHGIWWRHANGRPVSFTWSLWLRDQHVQLEQPGRGGRGGLAAREGRLGQAQHRTRRWSHNKLIPGWAYMAACKDSSCRRMEDLTGMQWPFLTTEWN